MNYDGLYHVRVHHSNAGVASDGRLQCAIRTKDSETIVLDLVVYVHGVCSSKGIEAAEVLVLGRREAAEVLVMTPCMYTGA